jgi:hypothetical protein
MERCILKTGLINYKGKKCVFKLKDFTLEIEEIENRDKLFIDSLNNLLGESTRSEEELPKTLLGIDFERGDEILFNVRNMNMNLSRTYVFNLQSYVVFKTGETSFNSLRLNVEELNWFHNIAESYEFSFMNDTGQMHFNVAPFEDSKKSFQFNLDGELINGELNITKQFSSMATSPLKLHTDLHLRFDETSDYSKIHKLIDITSNFLEFVTYRRNIAINHIILSKKDETRNITRPVADVFFNKEKNTFSEKEKIIKERMIDLPLIEENMGCLFNKLQKETIYLTHIPENSLDGRRITPSRFVMVTAGFEWQFRFSYKELSDKSEKESKTDEGKNELLAFLEQKIEETTGKKKKYFKGLKKRTIDMDMSLASKITWALNEFTDILDPFIQDIYRINQIKDVKYKDIAERIQNQRNDYAHGNIDKTINEMMGIDLHVLEWVYYAMVLNDIGMSKDNIQKSINKLFSRGHAL